MNLLVAINAMSNIIIALSVSVFIFYIFGRLSMMDKLPKWQSILVKVGLCVNECGSLFNFLTLSHPPLSEIVLNIGLAIIFTWAVLFHYKYFVKDSK